MHLEKNEIHFTVKGAVLQTEPPKVCAAVRLMTSLWPKSSQVKSLLSILPYVQDTRRTEITLLSDPVVSALTVTNKTHARQTQVFKYIQVYKNKNKLNILWEKTQENNVTSVENGWGGLQCRLFWGSGEMGEGGERQLGGWNYFSVWCSGHGGSSTFS